MVRRSVVWKPSDDEFVNLVKSSRSMSELLRHFGMENKGGNYHTCRKRIWELGLDYTHFMSREKSSTSSKKDTIEEFKAKLIENAKEKRSNTKRKLIEFNLIEYKCRDCLNTGVWNNKRISLQLEHINGVCNDNRLENLCFLCPNCHSQTDTFAGRNSKKEKEVFFCKKCSKQRSRQSNSELCIKCYGESIRKNVRPSKDELIKLIKQYPITTIAKMLNIKCDNSVRRWCCEYGINIKEISPYSLLNRNKIPSIRSKYCYVYFDSKRKVWVAIVRRNKKRLGLFRSFKTEEEAARCAANFINSEDLILR